jgi:exopolysaccharide biosynthesis WecB/TagA/CpsF family protein
VIGRAASARLMTDLAVARRGADTPAPLITSANGQVLSMCAQHEGIRDLFLRSDLIHADGMPLVFASRLLCKTPLPERVATTDLFHDVARIAPERDVTFYLLGATSAVIGEAARQARTLYPDLRIVGQRSGYFGPDEEAEVIAAINAARPDILWLGMGAPSELMFAMRHRDALRGVGLIKTAGGLFDFLSGKNPRAPQWLQTAGLEWAYRVYREPRRLAGRYLVTNPHAAFLLLTQTRTSGP